MASRQEEKERRREERLERERAESRAASRRKRLRLVAGALVGLAAVAAVVVAVVVGAGGESEAEAPATPSDEAIAALPRQQTSDLQEAAEAAGCELANPAFEGAAHDPDKEFTAGDYETNPPTSGAHSPRWYQDGIYNPGDTPELGMLVHTLEHGRINVQYKPGTPAETVRRLEAVLAEQSGGYHMLLYENTTGMDAQVAATAWTHSLTCPRMNDGVFDAIRTFRTRYIDQGPETVP